MTKISGKSSPAIRRVINFELRGQREAKGTAVMVDPQHCRTSLFVDRGMLSYDFSRYMVVDPPKAGYEFKPASGKILKEIVREGGDNVVFASNGQTDNLWCTNSLVVADGELIKRSAPGVLSDKFIPINGYFPFLVFDPNRPGITHIPFARGELLSPILFRNGISGPILLYSGRQQDFIKLAQPNIGPHEVIWDPIKNQASMSAAGITINGDFIFISLVGDPDKGNEPNLQDMLRDLSATQAILLGVSGDVQQYVRLGENEESWLIARARAGSTMAKMFPEARPLSNAIIVEDMI